MKIELEKEEAVNRYSLNLKREIGIQVRLLKPNTISEAQALAIETETWLKDSKPVKQIPRPPMKTWTKPTGLPRLNANTTPRAQNSTIPLSDRSKMNQNFEDSAEYLPYADDYEQLRLEEEQKDTDY